MVSAAAGEEAVPAAVALVAGSDPVRLVWRNELGGLTFEVGVGRARRFAKWAPYSSGIDLTVEAARLSWAAAFHPVPQVLEAGGDSLGSWLVTRAIAGESAVAPRWLADPLRAVVAIGEGLRALHEALPVQRCPFRWTAEDRVADARHRAALGRIHPARWEPAHRHLSVDQALRQLANIPPIDRLVVCHGDSCAPNTLLDDAGRWCGHVDLGDLGVADRWADLAVATWTTQRNYGPGFEALLLDAYGVATDDERINYYRLLWDVGP